MAAVANRAYHSPLREKQAEGTRATIIAAANQLLAEAAEVTHEAIAGRAGMSARTVYRHFPSRDDLLDGMWKVMHAQFGLDPFPRDEQELLRAMPQVFRSLDRHGRLVRAYLGSRAGQELRVRSNPQRQAEFGQCLARVTAGLDAAERARIMGVVQVLCSATGWQSLRDRSGLSGADAVKALDWALRTLLADVAKRSARKKQQ